MNIETEEDALKEGGPLSVTKRKQVTSTLGEPILSPPSDMRAVTGNQWALDAKEVEQIHNGVTIGVRKIVAEPSADRLTLYDAVTGESLGERWAVDVREIVAAQPGQYSLEAKKKDQ